MTITTDENFPQGKSSPEEVNSLLQEDLKAKFDEFRKYHNVFGNLLGDPESVHLLSVNDAGITVHPLTPTDTMDYKALGAVNKQFPDQFTWYAAEHQPVSENPGDLIAYEITIEGSAGVRYNMPVAKVLVTCMADIVNIESIIAENPYILIEISVSPQLDRESTAVYYREVKNGLARLSQGYAQAIKLLENSKQETDTPSLHSFKDPITPEEVVEDPKDEVTEFSETSEKQLQEEGIQKIMGEIQEFKELNGIGSTPLQEVRLRKYAEVLHSLIGQASAVLSEFGLDNKTYGAFFKWITEGMGSEYLFQQYNLRIARRGDKGHEIGVWRTVEIPSYENRSGKVDFTRPRTRVEVLRALGGYVTHMWDARLGNGVNEEQAAIIAAWNNFSEAVTSDLNGTLEWRNNPEDNKVMLAHSKIFTKLAANLISENGKSLKEILCPEGFEDNNIIELLGLLERYIPGFIEELKKDNHVELLRKYAYTKVFQHPDKDQIKKNKVAAGSRKKRAKGSGGNHALDITSSGGVDENTQTETLPKHDLEVPELPPFKEVFTIEDNNKLRTLLTTAATRRLATSGIDAHLYFTNKLVNIYRDNYRVWEYKEQILEVLSILYNEAYYDTSISSSDVREIRAQIKGMVAELHSFIHFATSDTYEIVGTDGTEGEKHGVDLVVRGRSTDQKYAVTVKSDSSLPYGKVEATVYDDLVDISDFHSGKLTGERQPEWKNEQTKYLRDNFGGRVIFVEASKRFRP